MSILNLEVVLPFDGKCHNKVDWSSVEQELSVSLPDDYKTFVERYGAGWIDDFILVLTPFTKAKNYNLIWGVNRYLGGYQSSKDSFPENYKYDIYDGNKGLFPWGVTENGDVLYWLFEKRKVKSVVVYGARGPMFYTVECGFSVFLCKVLNKEIVCDRFPKEFPSNDIKFIADVDDD